MKGDGVISLNCMWVLRLYARTWREVTVSFRLTAYGSWVPMLGPGERWRCHFASRLACSWPRRWNSFGKYWQSTNGRCWWGGLLHCALLRRGHCEQVVTSVAAGVSLAIQPRLLQWVWWRKSLTASSGPVWISGYRGFLEPFLMTVKFVGEFVSEKRVNHLARNFECLCPFWFDRVNF